MTKIIETNDIRDEMTSLRIDVFVKEQNIDINDEITNDDKDFTHYGLYIDNVLVSYLRAKTSKNTIYIGRVVTKKEYRNKGYSKMLFNYLENLARNKDIKYLILNSQEYVIPFYKHLGFEVCSDVFIDAGIKHYTMKKTLS